jgi:hypothetical protein
MVLKEERARAPRNTPSFVPRRQPQWTARSGGLAAVVAIVTWLAVMVDPSRIAPSAASPLDDASTRDDGTGDQKPARKGRPSRLDVEISPDGYTSARVCGSCHEDIYNSWKNSLHAFSLSDPIFDAAYMQALKDVGEAAKQHCLRCHAPMTLMNEDYDLKQGVTREGVSCDFCHTVTAVHLDNAEMPYSAELGLVKRSVLRKASSPAHEVAYSELHSKSEFCGGCHNYVAPTGAKIMSTYDEWLEGPYPAEGIQCQNCHMKLSTGNVVSREVQPSNPEIHLHSLIHDSEQLRSALSVEITRTQQVSRNLEVDVVVKNVGSGHKVPTGMPSREILLKVSVEAGSHSWNDERRYRKVIADARGMPLSLDHEMLLRGARILNDNRLAPREERLERFSFPMSQRRAAKVTATITYVYAPMLLEQRRLDIELDRAEERIF